MAVLQDTSIAVQGLANQFAKLDLHIALQGFVIDIPLGAGTGERTSTCAALSGRESLAAVAPSRTACATLTDGQTTAAVTGPSTCADVT